jgi:hypothetical protein
MWRCGARLRTERLLENRRLEKTLRGRSFLTSPIPGDPRWRMQT